MVLDTIQQRLKAEIIKKIKEQPTVLEDDPQALSNIDIDVSDLIATSKVSRIQELRSVQALRKANGSLVEVQYMIQSSFDPEMYNIAAIHPTKMHSEDSNVSSASIEVFKYHDIISSETSNINAQQLPYDESMVGVLADRSIFYAIPIPNVNAWACEKIPAGPKDTIPHVLHEESNEIPLKISNLTISPSADVNLFGESLRKAGIFNYEKNKATHAFPCVLKYYSVDANVLPKLNEIVKVIGVLSVDVPETSEQGQIATSLSNDMGGDIEEQDNYNCMYPESIIPRIHVLRSEIVSHEDILAMNRKALGDWIKSEEQEAGNAGVVVRGKVLDILADILSFDRDAAEYLLNAMISSVSLSKDGMSYGKIVLNLQNAHVMKSSNDGSVVVGLNERLVKFVEDVFVHSVHIPFSIPYLCANNVGPMVVPATNQVQYGDLQLPKHTKHFIICDETIIEQGTLDAKGIQNVSHINTMFADLKVTIASEYYKCLVDADISGVVLSQSKPVVHSDIQVKISPVEGVESVGVATSEGDLNEIRNYLMDAREFALRVQLDSSVTERIQTDFVSKRKEQAKEANVQAIEAMNQESLERWIHLTRLIAASKLKSIADIQDYTEMLALETRRIQKFLIK